MPVRHPAQGLLAALAGLSCLAVAGCAASQSAALAVHGQPGSHGPSETSDGTPATASTVIPTQLGDTWVYAIDSSALGKGTETNRISAVTPVAGGQRATLSSSLRLAGSKAPFRFASDFIAGADGSIKFGSTSFMGAKLASANVNWPSPAALTPGQARTSTVTGTYQATLLEQTVTDRAGGRTVIKAWVVNGIGQVKSATTVIVKGQREFSNVETLTSFTKG
jgi:hypothetical protein